MPKKIVAIWAEDENHLIGREGGLPWHLPKELKHFKETTAGNALLMGRVTFDGMQRRVLPNRETLVLSSELQLADNKVTVLATVQEVLDWFNKQDKTLFIVGGAKVYQAFEPYVDEIIRTRVHGELTGDTYFPDIDWSNFVLVNEHFFEKDDQNAYDFTVERFVRRKEE